MLKFESITLVKEDVLSLGRMVESTLAETIRLLKGEERPKEGMSLIEDQEETINADAQEIEEKCLDLLTELERETLGAREIRTLVSYTFIASKFERMADHAHRVARMADGARSEGTQVPSELAEMATTVHHMLQDLLLIFVTEDAEKAPEIMQRDSQVDYLHDMLSKRLLSNLSKQDQPTAQNRTQFLFSARFLERMGDACTSIAKRIYFIATGVRLKSRS